MTYLIIACIVFACLILLAPRAPKVDESRELRERALWHDREGRG